MYNFVEHQERRKRETEAAMAQVATEDAAKAAAEQELKARETAQALESLAANTVDQTKAMSQEVPSVGQIMDQASVQSNVAPTPPPDAPEPSLSSSSQTTNPT